MQCMMKSRKRL